MRFQYIKRKFVFFLIIVCSISYTERDEVSQLNKVCTLRYKGKIDELTNCTISVPVEVISFSERIRIDPMIIRKKSLDDKRYPLLFSFVLNGTMPISFDTSGGIFTCIFKYHFFLHSDTTIFYYSLFCPIFSDSIINNGDGTFDTMVVTKDTTIDGSFNIVRVEGAAPSDTFAITCWERQLGFYNADHQILAANATMNDLNIRFYYEPGDADYSYTNVNVELHTTAGDSRDTEILNLTDNGAYFMSNVTHTIIPDSSNPRPFNRMLQHHASDSLVAIFRNNESPRLPLDTLRYSIPFIPDIAIQPSSLISHGKFHYLVSRTGAGKYSITFHSLPGNGTVHLFTVNGRELVSKHLYKGTSRLIIPEKASSSVVIMYLEYGSHDIVEKLYLY